MKGQYTLYKIENDSNERYHLLFLGDLHGDIRSLEYIVGKHEHTVFVICGDIGIGFESKKHILDSFHQADETCVFKDNYVFMLRGNHDDPKYFNYEQIEWQRIKTVPDYSILNVDGINCLMVGGAISIDRTYRLKKMYDKIHHLSLKHLTKEQIDEKVKKLYWHDEMPYFDSEALGKIKEDGINIDIVCTHTCPSFCQPLTKEGVSYWLSKDLKLDEDLNKERSIMDELYGNLAHDGHKIKLWCYGHFHNHSNEMIENIEFVMLNAMDIRLDIKEYIDF